MGCGPQAVLKITLTLRFLARRSYKFLQTTLLLGYKKSFHTFSATKLSSPSTELCMIEASFSHKWLRVTGAREKDRQSKGLRNGPQRMVPFNSAA